MTDQNSATAAGADSATPESSIGADRIDLYITSVEQVLMAASVPAAERVQILGDLETQITEMLAGEPLPISDATVAAVIARLEPPSHFAANYATESQSTHAPAALPTALRYSPWVLTAVGSCGALFLSCFLLLLCAAESVVPPVAIMFFFLLLASAIVTPFALRKGVAQLRSAPELFCGQKLATNTALIYWTVMPLLALLFVSVITEGFALALIGFASCAYFQYLFLRRLYRRLTDQSSETRPARSLRDSLWHFTGLAQPAPC